MAVNVNQAGYERRLAVVEQLLYRQGLQPSKISTLAYSEEYKYAFNNYLYKVELALPASSSSFPGTQPGTVKAPSDGVSILVIKLSNLAAGMNDANRVENDVAAQHLVRQSMAQAGLAPLVPAIYAWASAANTDTADEKCFGWEQVLEQIAAVLAAVQAVRLPEGVTKFGGLTFDSNGRIVSGEAPLRKGEPVCSYAELMVVKLRAVLRVAAKSPVVQGWKSNGIDARIEKFVTGGGPEKVLAGVDLHQMGLIHGDFTILDFDWPYVSNPFDEFTSLLSDLGCNITHADNEINAAILSGDFTTLPANLDEKSTKQWEVAKVWNTAIKKSSAVSPSDMKGVDKIRDMVRLQTLLCPFELGSESMLKQMDDEKKARLRAETEANLVQLLEKYGF